MQNLKALSLMGLLSIILVFIGSAIGGKSGAFLFFIISLGINLFSYYKSDKIAIKMTRSTPISEKQAPELYEIIRKLTKRAGLPMPKIYRTPSPQPNAFATGRNPSNSSVAVTDGLLQILNKRELEGVLAHEMSHIKNRDILIGTIAASMAGAITMISELLQWSFIFGMGGDDEEGGGIAGLAGTLLLAILAPIAAMLIQFAISRSREYSADQTGAYLAGDPDGLASALLKLEKASHKIPMQVNPSTSHLFITNPLSTKTMARLFSTHPPIEDRVKRLKQFKK
ncbi:MAG: zinc metalloprotease HtpX [Clostridiales bacterium]|nr:zinc metalloprotease HtpX [Clostridiales bacterium]MCF8021396.1 zinc metalloprotease HtpX [Clostridiales bacterium]